MAQTNRKLLEDLLKKLGSTPQALSQRRDRLKAKVSMPTDIATYVIAHQQGLKLDKYLDLATIQTVNGFIRDLGAQDSPQVASPAKASPKRAAAKGSTTKEIHFERFKVPDGALWQTHVSDAEKMAGQAYPVLYVFENSAREFIDGHLTQAHGKRWWEDTKIVSKSIHSVVERNRKAEDKNRYHSKRNARFIYYTELGHLSTITQSEKGEALFIKGQLFPRKTWFPELVGRFEVSRNVVAHMNPLPKDDIRRLEDALKDWLKQIADRLPPKP